MKYKNFLGKGVTIDPLLLVLLVGAGFVYLFFVTQSVSTGSSGNQPSNEALFTAFFSLIAAITAIWNTYATHQNAVRIEEFKQILSTKYPALEKSREAALYYYRTLAKMEIQKLTPDAIEESEEEMTKAEGLIYLLDEKYRETWYDFWQYARNVSTISQDISKVEAQSRWRSGWAHEMGNKFKDVAMYQA